MVKPVMADSGVFSATGGQVEAEILSAFMDGELDPGDLEGMIRACDAEPGLAGDWAAYHCIGDVLRSADMGCHSERLSRAVCERLKDEPAVLAPVMSRQRERSGWRGHAGKAAAIAAVAVVGGMMVPRWTAIQEPVAGSTLAAPPVVSKSGPSSTPMDVLVRSGAPDAGPVVVPREYLAAHRQVSGSLAMQGVVGRVRNVSHDSGQ